MKRLILGLAIGVSMLFGATAVAEARFEAGRDYEVLPTPVETANDDSVEVREFFAYSCPHCFTFAGPMHDWAENQAPEEVEFIRTPVVFSDSWRPLAQAYHTAEALDMVEQTHIALFSAVHNERRRFRNANDLAPFFEDHGVDRETFFNTFNSFVVDMNVRRSEQVIRDFRITSTPSVAVAGKYIVNPSMVGSHERMLEVIDYLVRKEIAEGA
ncbi:hypothetical protein CAI21_08215 [Alkalilimnicola ehrlichii]|uniref:Thiol:disulfide interchange protein n=1 Tax=Alkalilimnicola ehrlichii TaxID=351052 RepID=A0A3E0WXH8_9GAMM|nr:thiol:disulfide interchange protein DsbA/DsbL [Alkalilimnicola ehrlichii]RFA30159.1 hypothetical protein CAI21_08215 [Alkalilimnicola ehrlichii]RFA37508.1 hypothetical protein CAL65_09565 [Alkalilimnicola ehrlichii]